MFSLGVDIGGTFTDFLLHDSETGETQAYKLPSTPGDPAEAVLAGVARACPDLAATDYLVHGTTVATNALLESRWARIGMITTAGHRDRVEIQRTNALRLYDLKYQKPPPLVDRPLRLEVSERVLADGTVLEALDAGGVLASGRALVAGGARVVAVCFLNSYVNPVHEQEAAAILRAAFPQLTVVASHEILPEIHEYERFSTTLLNCAVAPVMSRYIARIDRELGARGFRGTFLITQGNGGSMTADLACRLPVGTFQSGPAAGVIAALHVAAQTGLKNIITFDMGGTSTDVCIVSAGQPRTTHDYLVNGWPMRLPVLDIHSVGAGGGSLAWLDAGGGLHVGPRSAGAVPGPAAYGRGGDQPTVTDAHVLLGRLSARRPLAGKVPLDAARAKAALQPVAARLGMSPVELAVGILRIADSLMADAIRSISIDRGLDPHHYALVAYGGAGPLHAGRLAAELRIPRVLVPTGPGTHCALGCLVTDLRHDFVRSLVQEVRTLGTDAWETAFAPMEAAARDLLSREGIPARQTRLHRQADMRYRGQGQVSVTLPVPVRAGLAHLTERFHRAHQALYKHSHPDGHVEVVNLRVTVVGQRPKPNARRPAGNGTIRHWTESVFFDEADGFTECQVYDRFSLPAGFRLAGPAIVCQMDSTVVVYPGQSALVDDFGNLALDMAQK